MASCKLSVCLMIFATFVGLTVALQSGPRVAIKKVNNMTPSMQLDASDFLKRAATLNNAGDRCRVFKELFAEKYTQYKWHVVMYKAMSVTPIKSIHLTVDSDTYCLFATKK